MRILDATARKLGAAEKLVVTVDHHGNTSAASVPLALDEYVRAGKIRAGHRPASGCGRRVHLGLEPGHAMKLAMVFRAGIAVRGMLKAYAGLPGIEESLAEAKKAHWARTSSGSSTRAGGGWRSR